MPILSFSETSSSTFLLDTYTGATVAYSMFKLRSAYSGSCIRVRRSSDNTEQDIGFVNNYLDVVSLFSFVGGGNGFVVKWYDQSTNVRDLTQTASASNQPQIMSNGSLISRNGIAVIRASSTQWLSLAAIISGTVARSWWFSYEKDTAGNQQILGSSSSNYMFLDYTTSLYVGNSDFVTISPVLSTNTFRLMNNVYTTATYKLYSNGAQIGTNNGGTTTGSILYVPYNTFRTSTVFFNEFVYWATDQTSNRTAIESNIDNRNRIYVNNLNANLFTVYKAESNTNDSFGLYSGTSVGGLTYAAGKSGNAFIFNGSTAAVSLPNNTFNTLTGDFSISAWVYIPTGYLGTDSIYVLCDVYVPSWAINFKGISFRTAGNSLDFLIGDGTSYNGNTGLHILSYAITFTTNTWYHVVATRKASTGSKTYLNGLLVASNTDTTNPIFHTTQTPQIGRMYIPSVQNSYYAPNNSKIDEINIWNKELSASEVYELYNDGNGKFYPFT